MHNLVSCWRMMLCAASLLFGMGSSAFSAEVGLNFTAEVTRSFPFNPVYGKHFPIGTILSGHLVYESNTPGYSIASEYCADCAAYTLKQINGLKVQFPGLTAQADEYIIEVQNDVYVEGIGTADVLGVGYPDQSYGPSPDLGKPLLIDGSPVSKGSFLIQLVAPPTTFPTSQLPVTLDPSVFMLSPGVYGGGGGFGDGVPSLAAQDMFFTPKSVSAFPHSTSDHDLDGDVDGRDFLIWQRYAGENTGDGDADSNLLVDGDDLQMWQAEYGENVNDLAASVAVPEPAAITLLVSLCLVSLCRR